MSVFTRSIKAGESVEIEHHGWAGTLVLRRGKDSTTTDLLRGLIGMGTPPDSATQWNGSAYLVLPPNQAMSYYEARNKCAEMGGHLVRFNSKEELSYVSYLAVEKGTGSAYNWVDGCCVKVRDKYFYSDGSPLLYLKWAKWRPDYKQPNGWLILKPSWRCNYNVGMFSGSSTGLICEWD
jgi:hypothetical protein